VLCSVVWLVVLWVELVGEVGWLAVEPDPTLFGGVWLVTAGVPAGGFVVPVAVWLWPASALPAGGTLWVADGAAFWLLFTLLLSPVAALVEDWSVAGCVMPVL
jgi:hypothetical protein